MIMGNCPDCKGTGRVYNNVTKTSFLCLYCEGKGELKPVEKKIRIKEEETKDDYRNFHKDYFNG